MFLATVSFILTLTLADNESVTYHIYELMRRTPQNTSNARSDPAKLELVHQHFEAVNRYLP